jgi:hypothetical protein
MVSFYDRENSIYCIEFNKRPGEISHICLDNDPGRTNDGAHVLCIGADTREELTTNNAKNVKIVFIPNVDSAKINLLLNWLTDKKSSYLCED